jgi:hypothetical protein
MDRKIGSILPEVVFVAIHPVAAKFCTAATKSKADPADSAELMAELLLSATLRNSQPPGGDRCA